MKHGYATTLLALFGVAIVSSGCSETAEPKRKSELWASKNASKNIQSSHLGEVPGGLMDSKAALVPLLGGGGQVFKAVAVRDTSVVTNVKTKKSCSAKAGTSFSLIAQNGDFLRVLARADCGGDLKLVEGFVPLNDANEVVPKDVLVSTQAVSKPSSVLVATQALPASIIASAATPAPVPVPVPVPVPIPTPKYLGCTAISLYLFHDECDGTYRAGPQNLWENAGPSQCLIPGEVFRRPSAGVVTLGVYGTAASWNIKVGGSDVTLDAQKFLSSTGTGYSIPLDQMLGANELEFADVTWNVIGLDESGNAMGSECIFHARLVSPIVLNLTSAEKFHGLSLAESKAKFDLSGTGDKTATGWIKSGEGLLALDRNGNGIIDNGRELFGEATRLTNGNTASNGYAALAELDENKDGFITSADSNFGKLAVWVDTNSNGYTDKGELLSLASLKIERLGVAYSPSIRHANRGVLQNDVRYEGRYWGPAQCGNVGCLSFDVYFATMQKIMAQKSK